jgi:hypothetical protein
MYVSEMWTLSLSWTCTLHELRNEIRPADSCQHVTPLYITLDHQWLVLLSNEPELAAILSSLLHHLGIGHVKRDVFAVVVCLRY